MADSTGATAAKRSDGAHRKNLRVVGFPFGVEGANAVDFLEKWLPEILGLSSPIEIERAHRTLQRCPSEQGAPRAFVPKLLRYRAVTRILDAARYSMATPGL